MDNKIIYRLAFYKKGLLKYLGTNDFLNVINRALRRAEVPIKYSQGYNPRPIISLGFPCPIGVESYREYLDIELTKEIEKEIFIERINKELPSELQFYEILKIEKKSSLIEDTYGINYELYFFSHINEMIEEEIKNFNNLDSYKILVRRGSKVKEIDLKAHIIGIKLVLENRNHFILHLNTLKCGNSIIRGEEVLEIFSIKPYLLRQIREVILNV